VDSSAAVAEEAPPQTDPVATPVTATAGSPDKRPVQEETVQLTPVTEENATQVASESEPAELADPEPGSLSITPEPVPATQSESSQSSVSTPPSPLSDSGSDSPIAAVDSSSEKTAYELLAAAREAYWLRDYEGAEVFYRQLIEVEPDNPDGYGELGNMYFSQGQWEQAAAEYYEAGVRMVNEGKAEQARQLVDVIRGLNGGQADELEKQVDAARQNTP
jgi:tetratricopeptide (TPR) repeat protein